MDPTYSIEKWARFALTGDMASATPADPQLAPVVASVTAQLAAANPCIGEDPLTYLTSQSDLDAFAEWAGYMVASRYITSPAGALLSGASGGTVKVKIGPVERTRKDVDAKVSAAGYLREGMSARLRISCIREAVGTANRNGENDILDVAGRRRTIGTDNTVEGGLLGSGRCGRV